MLKFSLQTVERVAAVSMAVAVIATAVASRAGAQPPRPGSDFTWDGRVAAGRTLQIRNINGTITVERTSGDRVEVVATKRWRRGDPSIVRIEAIRYGPAESNVLVCAIWGSATCDEAGYHGRNRIDRENGDVRVDFTVRLPDGVLTRIESVNGDISILGATADVDAQTVNGAIEIRTASPDLRASSVNGSIDVRLDSAGDGGSVHCETVNGSITLYLPPNFRGELDLETVNGSVNTDFPMTVQGRFDPRHIRSRVGTGGPRLSLETVNGSIELRRVR